MTPRAFPVRPPFIAVLCIAASWSADAALGTVQLLPAAVRIAGPVVAAGGVALAAWALLLFVRRHTPPDPFDVPTAFVATGPYRFTRNPMYLGIALVLAGASLWNGTPVILIAPVVFLITMSVTWIRHEERLMAETFGEPYLAYRRRVRRWL